MRRKLLAWIMVLSMIFSATSVSAESTEANSTNEATKLRCSSCSIIEGEVISQQFIWKDIGVHPAFRNAAWRNAGSWYIPSSTYYITAGFSLSVGEYASLGFSVGMNSGGSTHYANSGRYSKPGLRVGGTLTTIRNTERSPITGEVSRIWYAGHFKTEIEHIYMIYR